jgi:uncharacterized protein (DUF1684 family)
MSDLENFRAQKNEFLKAGPDSPLEPEQRRLFHGLEYFPEAPSLRFFLRAQLLPEQESVRMPLSTGEEAEYIRWAKVEFGVDERAAELTLFVDVYTGELFLPFKDATALSSETYGGGRYLDVGRNSDGTFTLDFNYAYNPYCAYNDNWACPLPPPENLLEVPIRAGEKTFPRH